MYFVSEIRAIPRYQQPVDLYNNLKAYLLVFKSFGFIILPQTSKWVNKKCCVN